MTLRWLHTWRVMLVMIGFLCSCIYGTLWNFGFNNLLFFYSCFDFHVYLMIGILVSSKEEVGASHSFRISPVDLNGFFDEDGKIYGYNGLKVMHIFTRLLLTRVLHVEHVICVNYLPSAHAKVSIQDYYSMLPCFVLQFCSISLYTDNHLG